MSERRYTLAEAERIRALRSCDRHGHDWNVMETLGGGPHAIVCTTCGWSGAVEMSARPKTPKGTDDHRHNQEAP